jgi:3-keto-disaccharide hydrolase
MMRNTAFLLVLSVATLSGGELFNGKNLDGWSFVGPSGQEGFVVKDGMITTAGAPEKMMLWYSREKLGNGTLRVVYRMSNGKGNSGVFIRIPESPKSEDDAIHKGIEVQIDDRDNDWHCTGVLYSMTKALARPSRPAGEWNTMEIKMDGLRTIVHLNGVLVTDYDGVSPVPPPQHPWEPKRGPRPAEGYIALQHHDNEAVIEFKEIGFTSQR